MKIAVIGTGYVGTCTAAGFADFGVEVVCVDIDASKIARLKKCDIPIYEPGLDTFVARGIKQRLLSFTTDISLAISGSDVIFITVGTPQAKDGSADLQYVIAAAASIGKNIDNNAIIVLRSTAPIGTTEMVRDVINANTKARFDVAFCPEFLKEGVAMADFMKPDRVVVGTESERVREIMTELFTPICAHRDCLMFMDIRSAELTKYASNAMLATRISFMNEMAALCEKYGADIESVRGGMSLDQRIGSRFLFAGVGYGGSCFGKDIQASISMGRKMGLELKILEAVHEVNETQKSLLANKIISHFNNNVEGKTIALLGLSFKPDTDDLRDASSLKIIEKLLANGAKIQAYDPIAMANLKMIYGEQVSLCENMYNACKDADGMALITEWHEFRKPNFNKIKKMLKTPVIFDGRNIWDGSKLRSMGFTYYGIGRK